MLALACSAQRSYSSRPAGCQPPRPALKARPYPLLHPNPYYTNSSLVARRPPEGVEASTGVSTLEATQRCFGSRA